MSVKTSNGVLNFLYRIFIQTDEVDTDSLDMNSSDPTERTLAEASEKHDKKYKEHFSSSSGNVRDSLKLDESQLNKDTKSSNSGSRVQNREDDELSK